MADPTRRDVIAGVAALGAAACTPRVTTTHARGMVATTQRPATDAGVAILRAGGSAADAAIAAAAALAVTEPMSTGLGGDCFALFYDARTQRISALNGSGRAPAALTPDLIRARGLTAMPDHGPLAVTVPGACAGWFDLIGKHGRLPMTRIVEPAIELAERGFPVGEWTAFIWERAASRLASKDTYLVDGRAPHAGELFKNPPLAATLRTIAAGGKESFYRGEIAESIVATLKQAGGVMELADLAAHTSTWDEPISTTYRDHTIWECPPNGQGLVPLLALNMLETFDLRSLPPLGAERLHLIASALRLAFADAAAFLGDPRVAPVPVQELLAKSYAKQRAALITPHVSPVTHGSPRGRSDTVYLCAVDADGNACSFINSNFDSFGSGLVTRGFALQNRGASFVLEPNHPDVLAPNKRPYHTIIPGLITRADHSLYAPFGVMGGFMQPQGHVQVVTGLLDDDLTPQAALDRPRICLHNPGSVWPADDSTLELFVEHGITADLASLGYKTRSIDGFRRLVFGRGQIIRRSHDGVLEGGSDPRGDGYAA